MKTIDLDTWPRKSMYDYFRSLPSPHFTLTADVDVTTLIDTLKPQGISVFNAALFAIMRACNSIPEMRQRLRGDTVVEHDTIHPAPTVPIEGDRFAFCYFDYASDWKEFNRLCNEAIEIGKQQTELEDESSARDDLIFTTCLPWVAFTSMTHPVQGPDDSVPRVAWGKFHQRDGRWIMPVNLHVHHALADGLHTGKFYQVVQKTFDEFEGLI